MFVCPEHIMFTMMRNVDGTEVWTGGLPSQDITEPPQGPGLMIALLCYTATLKLTRIIETEIS